MTTIDIDEATRNAPDPLRRIIEDRVEELLRFRHWYRVHRSINLDTIEAIHNAELRALVRLLRAARLQEKADTVWRVGQPPRCSVCGIPIAEHPNTDACAVISERLDPVTAGKAYWDWQSGR